ncbi:MAG TPA: cytochrome P460 family protein [Gemmatimonadaceae bacterium]|nr:cytochrome P460 family protein [Gemmatimonadaceae bacterium]
MDIHQTHTASAPAESAQRAYRTLGHFSRDSPVDDVHYLRMPNTTHTRARAAVALTSLSLVVAFAAPRFIGVPYPTGFRQWTHIKSMVVLPSSPAFSTGGGMHHVYANAAAMGGFSSGHFADGSILVFDLLKASENAGVIASGDRERLDVMVKDSRRYAATGGWGFERFMGNDTTPSLTEEHRKLCVECHDQRTDHDRVFSAFVR